MSKTALIQRLEKKHLRTDHPPFHVGDTVKVHIRIIEGDKERVQVFQGTVIARKGTGMGESFTVHRVAYGEGMVRVFPLNSPRVSQIEVVKEGDVRRAKLYNLIGTSGKKARVKGRVQSRYAKNGGSVAKHEEVVEEIALAPAVEEAPAAVEETTATVEESKE